MSTCSYDSILTNVERVIRTPENNGNEGNVLRRYGRFAFQQMAFGLFQAVNMHSFMPRSWIPPLEMNWGDEPHEHPQFPNKELRWTQIYNAETTISNWNFKGVDVYRGKSVFFNEL